MMVLEQNFYAQSTLVVARALLGQRLIRMWQGQRLSGRIVETEAYIGPEDSASHASKGRTNRTGVMFGPPGYAYIYLIYGMHHMLNLVTEAEGFPAAVLIRALEPVEGITVMQRNRRLPNQQPGGSSLRPNLTNGPGKLCQALGIDKRFNNWNVTLDQQLWLEQDQSISDEDICTGPRIGINYARLPDRLAPWRFWIDGSRFVSRL